MWPAMGDLSISGLQADALFASRLQRGDEPSASQVRQAVAAAIREFGCSGCTARVARGFGDHPETAVLRMRWARALAGAAFEESALQPASSATADGRHAPRPRLPADGKDATAPSARYRSRQPCTAPAPAPI
jgi:hypothetical protein